MKHDFTNQAAIIKGYYLNHEGSTHYEDCWKSHPRCAISRLTHIVFCAEEEIKRLEKALGEQTESVRKWKNREHSKSKRLAKARQEAEHLKSIIKLLKPSPSNVNNFKNRWNNKKKL